MPLQTIWEWLLVLSLAGERMSLSEHLISCVSLEQAYMQLECFRPLRLSGKSNNLSVAFSRWDILNLKRLNHDENRTLRSCVADCMLHIFVS